MDLFETLPSSSASSPNSFSDSSASLECPVCLEDQIQSSFLRLKDCQHAFCLGCFKQHLHTKIQDRKVLKITCPQDGCPHILPPKLLEAVLEGSEFNKYKEIVLQKVNARGSLNKFCPQSGCSKPYISMIDSPYTTCSCGANICNKCGRKSHGDKDCIEALDYGFESFAQENNFKFCFMCKTVVDRMQGCTHITCPVCDYEWCWLCGNEHTDHHVLKCSGKWNPVPPQKLRIEDEPDGWKKSGKSVGRITLFLWHIQNIGDAVKGIMLYGLLLPLRFFLWPIFIIDIVTELRTPLRTTADKVKTAIIYFMINLVHESIIGVFIWFAITFKKKNPGVVTVFGVLLLIICTIQFCLFARRKERVANRRWETRDSNVFRYHYIENSEERTNAPNNRQQLAEQAQENLENMHTTKHLMAVPIEIPATGSQDELTPPNLSLHIKV